MHGHAGIKTQCGFALGVRADRIQSASTAQHTAPPAHRCLLLCIHCVAAASTAYPIANDQARLTVPLLVFIATAPSHPHPPWQRRELSEANPWAAGLEEDGALGGEDVAVTASGGAGMPKGLGLQKAVIMSSTRFSSVGGRSLSAGRSLSGREELADVGGNEAEDPWASAIGNLASARVGAVTGHGRGGACSSKRRGEVQWRPCRPPSMCTCRCSRQLVGEFLSLIVPALGRPMPWPARCAAGHVQ